MTKHKLHMFNFLKEVSFLNNRVLLIIYEDGTTSADILAKGAKHLPRKQKKRLKKLIWKTGNMGSASAI